MLKIPRVAAYCRVSTLDQHADIQVEAIRRAARERGWNLVAEHVDAGISGARDRRPALDALVYDGASRLVRATPSGQAATNFWYGPANAVVEEVQPTGTVRRFGEVSWRGGVATASVLPWLSVEGGSPRYVLAEPDGRRSARRPRSRSARRGSRCCTWVLRTGTC